MGERECPALIPPGGGEQGEFVGTDARHEIGAAGLLAQATGDGEQQLVAGQRADALVDPAEAAQVDDQ